MQSFGLFPLPSAANKKLSSIPESGSDSESKEELSPSIYLDNRMMLLPKVIAVYPHIPTPTLQPAQCYAGAMVNHPDIGEFLNTVYANVNTGHTKIFTANNNDAYFLSTVLTPGYWQDFLFLYKTKDMLTLQNTTFGGIDYGGLKKPLFYRVIADTDNQFNCYLKLCKNLQPKLPYLFFFGSSQQRSYMMQRLLAKVSELSLELAEHDEVKTQQARLIL
jgi:hypothetical protein